jgi:general secretion pathway protein A
MYEGYYGFTEKPFNLTPDPKYLYQSRRHTEAAAHLEYGRRERGGFILITGEVGTGKTTLARYFLGRLPEGTATAVVLYPALTAAELLQTILDDLKAPREGASLKDLVDALHRFLLRAREEHRDVVLLIDEAQDLSPEVLEQIRLISNLETDTQKLIQIVLIGQSELAEMLARRELRQLAQRVTARYHLAPLSRQETDDYVRHRLAVAGGAGKVSFPPRALAAVHRLSGGIPRLINLICDRALLAGYVRGTRVIEADMVRQAAAESVGEARRPGVELHHYAAVIVGALVLAGLAYLLAFPRPLTAPGSDAGTLGPAPSLSAAVPTAETLPSGLPSAAGASPTRKPPSPGLLEAQLTRLPREASYAQALAQVQALWGGGPLQRTALRTHLRQLERLDLPVVLEMFHPTRRDTCFVALVGLADGEATVAAGEGPPLRASLLELDPFWTRDAVVLWRDFDLVAGASDPTRAAAWAEAQLGRLGYAGPATESVSRFQAEHELVADGVVGSRTILTLYSRGDWPRPRLRAKDAPRTASATAPTGGPR